MCSPWSVRGRPLEMTAIIIITIKTIQKQLSRQGKWKGRAGAGGGVVRGKGCGGVGGGVSIPVTQR